MEKRYNLIMLCFTQNLLRSHTNFHFQLAPKMHTPTLYPHLGELIPHIRLVDLKPKDQQGWRTRSYCNYRQGFRITVFHLLDMFLFSFSIRSEGFFRHTTGARYAMRLSAHTCKHQLLNDLFRRLPVRLVAWPLGTWYSIITDLLWKEALVSDISGLWFAAYMPRILHPLLRLFVA